MEKDFLLRGQIPTRCAPSLARSLCVQSRETTRASLTKTLEAVFGETTIAASEGAPTVDMELMKFAWKTEVKVQAERKLQQMHLALTEFVEFVKEALRQKEAMEREAATKESLTTAVIQVRKKLHPVADDRDGKTQRACPVGVRSSPFRPSHSCVFSVQTRKLLEAVNIARVASNR